MGLPSLQANLVPILLKKDAIAADNAAAHSMKMPFKGLLVGAYAGVNNHGGSTPHTDVDIMAKQGSTDLFAAAVAAVDSSTPVSGGVEATLTATKANRVVAKDAVLVMSVDITGGSSPVSDCWVHLLFQRLE